MDPTDEDYGRSRAPIIILGVAVAAVAAGAAYWFLRGPTSTAPATAPVASAPPTAPAAAPIAPADLAPAPDAPPPPPADGDALFRRLVNQWTNVPDLAKWAAAESIVQRLAAAANMVAAGANPRPMLTFIDPPGGAFVVDEQVEKGAPNATGGVDVRERDFISPKAYARYDKLTALINGVDPVAAGAGYRQLRPYLDGAFAQIAQPGERFDTVMKAALDRLLAVPVPQGPLEVVPQGAIYKYVDPALEGLRPAEKQLLRFGPTNQETLRTWLRKFAAAAGLATR